MPTSVKHSGQVFTPDYLVNMILDEADYRGPFILRKHCIDNSCGEGAFVCATVRRYAKAYAEAHQSTEGLAHELATYIHGIEIDPEAHRCCLDNLHQICTELGIDTPPFDIQCADALTATHLFGQMDYVVGNPPYVRVHNLENSYESVKRFSFAADGMTDLYLVFFELGFKMLREGGKLAYITPSSWLNSLAGSKLRDYIRRHKTLQSLIDIGHFQPFKATTYTLVATFTKGETRKEIAYYAFDEAQLNKSFVSRLTLSDIDINGYFYLSTPDTLARLRQMLTSRVPKYVTAKNGFATLADSVFIADNFPFTPFVIPTIKASTGKWRKAFFPYDKKGKPLSRNTLQEEPEVWKYLASHKADLLKTATEQSCPEWYLYGRTQALKDVEKDKLAVNTTIKDVKSIKLNRAPKGTGVYSGLYLLTEVSLDVVEKLLKSEDFVSYIASLKKYKSGGYYTFNSKDLELYLNFRINQLAKRQLIQLPQYEQQGLFSGCY